MRFKSRSALKIRKLGPKEFVTKGPPPKKIKKVVRNVQLVNLAGLS